MRKTRILTGTTPRASNPGAGNGRWAARIAWTVLVAAGAAVAIRLRRTSKKRVSAGNPEQLTALGPDSVAVAAHELGAVAAAIHRWIDALETGMLGTQGETEAFASLRAETNLLFSLASELQRASASGRGDLATKLRPVPLAPLLDDARAFAEILPGGHPVLVSYDAHHTVLADPARIPRVLHNLLDNAAKYSPDGSPIELRVAPGKGLVRVEVVDRGGGIGPEELERLFGREPSVPGREVPSAGLGLYLSRMILRSLGSELYVESTPGVGSVFGFDLEVVPK